MPIVTPEIKPITGAAGLYSGEVQLNFDSGKHVYTYQGRVVPSVTQILGVLNKPVLIPWACKMMAEDLNGGLVVQLLDLMKEADTTIRSATDVLNRDRVSSAARGQVASSLSVLLGALRKGVNEITLRNAIDSAKGAHKRKKTDAGSLGTLAHDWVADRLQGRFRELPVHEAAATACKAYLSWEQEHTIKVLASEKRIFSRIHMVAGTTDLVCEIDGELGVLDLKTSNGIWDEMGYQLAGYQLALEEEGWGPFSFRKIIRLGKDPTAGVIDLEVRDFEYEQNRAVFLACREIYRAREGK